MSIVIPEPAFMKAAQKYWADILWVLGKSMGSTPGSNFPKYRFSGSESETTRQRPIQRSPVLDALGKYLLAR